MDSETHKMVLGALLPADVETPKQELDSAAILKALGVELGACTAPYIPTTQEQPTQGHDASCALKVWEFTEEAK